MNPRPKLALVRTYARTRPADIAQPLGIMALDAYLRVHGYDQIDLYDMRLRFDSPAQALDRALRTEPDVVGLSTLSQEKDQAHELARRIKQRAPKTRIVVGGPYATGGWKTVLRDRNIDACVLGEGEIKLKALLEAWTSGQDLATVSGLAFRRGDDLFQTPGGSEQPDINTLPMPSWDRIDVQAYHDWGTLENMSGRRWAILMTSRGCPYACTYCHGIFGRRFRALSADQVLDEMTYLVEKRGIGEFWISDDIFNLDRDRLLEICGRIQRQRWNVAIQFPNGMRADLMDVEMLKALKAAGCYRISYAVESGAERIQKLARKRLDLGATRRIITETRRLGILVHGFFMLGFPTETREEIEASIEFACRSDLHTAAFFLTTPFEGSELGDACVREGAGFAVDGSSIYHHEHGLAAVPQATVRRLQRKAYLRFYSDPVRLAAFARLIPDKRKLVQYAATFAALLADGADFAFRPGFLRGDGHAGPSGRSASTTPRRPS